MNKSKILGATLIVVIFVLIIYFGYNNYQEKNRLKNDKLELTYKIEHLQQTIARNNQIIADNEQSKRELENQSTERQEQINEQLKNNDCAGQLVPVSVSNSLYNRAQNLRQPTAIPAHLLNDCVPRLPPKSMTFGDSLKYNEHLLNVIEMCNRDKRAIRLINQ